MAIRIEKKFCPHCEKQITYEINTNRKWGSVILNCPKCGKPIIDKSIYELGLEDLSYYRKHVRNNIIVVLLLIALIATAGLAITKKLDPIISLIAFFVLLITSYIYTSIFCFPKITESFENDYEESVKRLNDPKYIALLKELKYDFPKEFIKKHPEFFQKEAPPEKSTKSHTKEAPVVENQFIYCRKCGTKLPSDSVYCVKCGSKL